MTNEIQMYIKDDDNGETSPPMIWDAAKAVLRGKIIAVASLKKKLRQRKLLDLQNQLKLLEGCHAQGQDPKILQQIQKIRNEINIIYTQEIEKKMLFAKQRYYENGSKFTKLLAWKLKKQQANMGLPKKYHRKQTRSKLSLNHFTNAYILKH